MATLGANNLTLADWAKRLDPDGSVAAIAEVLNQTNEIVGDMNLMEGNLPTGHQTTIRTGLPTPAWRKLNGGVSPTKSTTAQVTEGIGMLEDWVNIDKDEAELNGNTAEFRFSEAIAHIEGIGQELASTIIYGDNTTAPEEFLGLAPRYNSLSAANGQNIIDCQGAGSDNTSIWLIVHGPQTFSGIFPKGSKAGILHEDLGLQTVQTGTGISGGNLRAYQDHFQVKQGICLKDWRYVVRLANIDVSNLVSGSSAADLIQKMVEATHHIPNLDMGKACFYANRTASKMLDVQAMEKTNAYLTVGEEEGKKKVMLRGIPVKKCDAILENEAAVS